ncbi:DUF551 domain-containing protein [Leclercia sp. UBA5958]|uniref:DUF551 domain-containing protein n=1 Tax=Leclercia sp. UBA5958 TaxID=1946742 RepID=UPI00257B0D85|nr:DUF551 domain-containing protein [Leclercia sp. UBA5958]
MTLTKEWLLKTIAELEEERDATPGAVNEDASMALAAMKMALKSMTAEPVAYIDPLSLQNFATYRAGETDNKRMGREWSWANSDAGLEPVYAAQPAPVVPDALPKLKDGQRFKYVKDGIRYSANYANGWNACRAAVLQGAAGNSPAIPDSWVTCSERMPTIGVPVITCCGDVVQYAVYAWDGKVWQDWYEEYDKLPSDTFTHWHPHPAAPQQEAE